MSRALELENDLRRRFAVREELFVHGDIRLELILPRSAEELLDEEAFEKDERMPYWADLWPSAKALARWLLDQPVSFFDQRLIELGSGVGLPSLAVSSRGGQVIATDHNEDALLFAQCNALRNQLPPLCTQLLDWRDEIESPARFDVALASDVLYEKRNIDSLFNMLRLLVDPRGRLVLADPGRAHLPEFIEEADRAGWSSSAIATIRESQITSQGARFSDIQLIELARR